ncbi:MalY/PatB family protein [bacterium RCC_150]
MTGDQFTSIDRERLRIGYGVKWGFVPGDVLPSWVADMDFGTPPTVREAMAAVLERGDLGYAFWRGEDPVVEAFERRMATRYGWAPQSGRTKIFTDLIQVLQVMIEHSTKPGDGIAVHVPAYPPFLATIERSGRRIVPIPMIDVGGGWGFDGENLSSRLRAENCRMLVLVNPQNPTGRVFSRNELEDLAGVADELDLIVLADEIHSDLTFEDHRHVPFASLGRGPASRTITATSATKAFNIAGMRCAVAHIGPTSVWDALEREPLDYFGQPSILSRVATVAAWNDSDAWLDQLKQVLAANRNTIKRWVNDLPDTILYYPPEATYLSWFNFSHATGADRADPATDLESRAKVKLSQGAEFSQHTSIDSSGYARLNFATSPANLVDILERMRTAIGGASNPPAWSERKCVF